MTTKTRTKNNQLKKKSGELEKELSGVQEKINATRRELGEAVLANGDGTSAKIAGLETALSKLQDREQGLQAALEVGQGAIEESRDQATRADFKQDQAEVKRIDKRLNEAALVYIKRNYQDRDETNELIELYNRATILTRKHGDTLTTIDFHKAAQVIGAVRRTVVPVSRSIEVFAPDLVKAAGEQRRF